MPLYMDLHKGVHGMTRDEMDHIHKADLNVQDQFDAKICKFWVNEEAGTVFCLIEAPSKEACKAIHANSHGITACEIIEVRSSLLANEGKEVKHTGDGIMACFLSAVNAVNAAIQIQKDLKKFRDKNLGYPLDVRIGLNTGEPVTEGVDFFGTAVQLAARICNKAASCQVLVSNIVKDLCMGKGIHFHDMGQAELKGFNSLIPIYEVSWQASR